MIAAFAPMIKCTGDQIPSITDNRSASSSKEFYAESGSCEDMKTKILVGQATYKNMSVA